MSDDRTELPPEHLVVGPNSGIYQVVLYDPSTRTRFTLQIVRYHDFPDPVQRSMGFLRDIMIEPMSEVEIANFFGVPSDHPIVIGDGAAGDPLTPTEVEKLREEMAEAEAKNEELLSSLEEEEAEAAAARSIEAIRRKIIEDKKEDK